MSGSTRLVAVQLECRCHGEMPTETLKGICHVPAGASEG